MSNIQTARSRKLMQDRGFIVETVEHYNSFTQRKHDFLGIFDLLCMHPETGEVAAVQTTSYSNLSSRIRKITESPHLALVRKCGWTVLAQGWKKLNNGRYALREENLS